MSQSIYSFIKSLICYANSFDPTWFRVRSPRDVGNRVNLVSSNPIMMLVIARRISQYEIPSHSPQQSDYTVLWDREKLKNYDGVATVKRMMANVKKIILKLIPETIKFFLKRKIYPSPFNGLFFTKFNHDMEVKE